MSSTYPFITLNVVCHPHPDGVYRRLFKAAERRPVKFWGEQMAAIGPVLDRDDDEGVFTGRIAIWTRVDTRSDVIDLSKFEEVAFTASSVVIPSNVGLNSKVFYFAFRERDHKLFVHLRNESGKSVSPKRIESAFHEILSADRSVADEVFVTLVPEHDSVERALGIPQLRRVEMQLRRPNPDDLDDDVRGVLEELEGQGAKSQDIKLVKAPGSDTLVLNGRNRLLANVAAITGLLRTTGRDDDDRKVEYSTKDHPKMIFREVAADSTILATLRSLAKYE